MAANFDSFIEKFPEAVIPLTVTEEDSHQYSMDNPPFSERLIDAFIMPIEEEADDMTEFVPCFRLPKLKDHHAMVYWRAGLMNYQYVLVTYSKSGQAIDRRVIAGTFSDGKTITRSVARIDEDHSIYIMTGQTDGSAEIYDAASSRTVELELMPDGRIIEISEDDE
jgi:hypothetical protein